LNLDVIGPRFVALTAAGEPTPEQAEALIRAALAERGEAPWDAMEIDLYPGSGSSLILARPAAGTRVYIADWAMRFLMKGLEGE